MQAAAALTAGVAQRVVEGRRHALGRLVAGAVLPLEFTAAAPPAALARLEVTRRARRRLP